jgi:hypothetical protein
MRITLLLFFLSFINAQIALPTFQAVHTPHSTTSGTPENPLQSMIGDGTMWYEDATWTYMIGYRFTPNVNGTITQLGGRFDGTHTVRLWKRSNQSFLGSVSVTDPNNTWSYADLSSSVSVTSGEEYIVMVYSNGYGMCAFQFSPQLPNTNGNITINYTCYKQGYNSDTYPPSWDNQTRTDAIFGMPDITFVPDE